MTLLRWLTFSLRSVTVTPTVLPFRIYLFFATQIFVLQLLFFHWEILIMFSQFLLTFCQTQNMICYFIVKLMTILELIGRIFVIIWEIFHGRISLNSVLLLRLVNFLIGFRLELMYISHIVNIRSSLTQLHGFQLLVRLPYFVEITFFFLLYQQNKSLI